MKKQFIAKLLALALVLSLAPAAFAATATGNAAGTNYGYYDVYEDTTPITTTTVDAADVTVEAGEVAIEAKVVDGAATVVVSEKAMEALAEQVEGDVVVLKIAAEGASKVDVSIPAGALTAFAESTNAALTIESPIATITIPNEALATLFGDAGTVKITAQASGSSVGFSIQLSGKALKNIKGLQVTF